MTIIHQRLHDVQCRLVGCTESTEWIEHHVGACLREFFFIEQLGLTKFSHVGQNRCFDLRFKVAILV